MTTRTVLLSPSATTAFHALLSRNMEGMRNLLCGKGLRVVKRLVGDILGVQIVADPLGYGHLPLLQNELRPFPTRNAGQSPCQKRLNSVGRARQPQESIRSRGPLFCDVCQFLRKSYEAWRLSALFRPVIILMRNSTHDRRGFFLCGMSKDFGCQDSESASFGET